MTNVKEIRSTLNSWGVYVDIKERGNDTVEVPEDIGLSLTQICELTVVQRLGQDIKFGVLKDESTRLKYGVGHEADFSGSDPKGVYVLPIMPLDECIKRNREFP